MAPSNPDQEFRLLPVFRTIDKLRANFADVPQEQQQERFDYSVEQVRAKRHLQRVADDEGFA